MGRNPIKGAALAFTLFAVALAGCAEEAGPVEAEEPVSFQELKATPTTGIIRGVVIDETITPIMGATVSIQNLELDAVTDADGAFGFQGLPAGTYFLDVDALGYGAAQSQADVVVGIASPDIVKVMLAKDASELPYVEQFTFNGFIQCSGSTPAYRVAICGAVNAVFVIAGQEEPLDDAFIAGFDIDMDPDFIQAEMVWESTQPLGDEMMFTAEVQAADGFAIGTVAGPSPLVMSATKDLIENATMDTSGFMQQRVFNMEHPATTPPVPVCGIPNYVHGGEMCLKGVGLTLDQGFEIFTHNFHGFLPAAGWTFIERGAPSPP